VSDYFGAVIAENNTGRLWIYTFATSFVPGSNYDAGMGVAGDLLLTDQSTAIAGYHNGLPFQGASCIAYSLEAAVVRVHNGIPYDASNRVAFTTGAVDHYHNGLPYDSSGRVCVSTGGPG